MKATMEPRTSEGIVAGTGACTLRSGVLGSSGKMISHGFVADVPAIHFQRLLFAASGPGARCRNLLRFRGLNQSPGFGFREGN